jgi:Na+/H+ antiporter NhaC
LESKSKLSKSKLYGFLIISLIALLGVFAVAYFQFSETQTESAKIFIQKDLDSNVKTLASVAKSTLILVICVGIVGLLVLRGKKDTDTHFSVKGQKQ